MARMPLRKPLGGGGPPPVEQALNYADFESKWPMVMAFLFDETYDDRSRRQTGTLLFFTERGVLKACLNDRDLNRACFIAVSDLVEALDDFEVGLNEENLDWRTKKSS